jgi:hypothetical protein
MLRSLKLIANLSGVFRQYFALVSLLAASLIVNMHAMKEPRDQTPER